MWNMCRFTYYVSSTVKEQLIKPTNTSGTKIERTPKRRENCFASCALSEFMKYLLVPNVHLKEMGFIIFSVWNKAHWIVITCLGTFLKFSDWGPHERSLSSFGLCWSLDLISMIYKMLNNFRSLELNLSRINFPEWNSLQILKFLLSNKM